MTDLYPLHTTTDAPRGSSALQLSTLRAGLIEDWIDSANQLATGARVDPDYTRVAFAHLKLGAARALARYMVAAGDYPNLDAAILAVNQTIAGHLVDEWITQNADPWQLHHARDAIRDLISDDLDDGVGPYQLEISGHAQPYLEGR